MNKNINNDLIGASMVAQRQLRELRSLEEMNKKIHATMNIDQLLQILVNQAIIGVNFERGLIYLLEDDFLRCVAYLDRVKKEKATTIKNLKGFSMDETAVEVLAVRTGESFHVADAETDQRVSRKLLKITDSKEYCVVPLVGRSGVLGVLTGDNVYSRSPIRPEDIKTLELFAGHISLAIENAALFEEKERFAALLEEKIAERTLELAQANEQLQEKMKELSTLFEISKSLNRSLGVDEVLELILFLVKGLGYTMCSVHLWEGDDFGRSVQMGMGDDFIQKGFPALKEEIRDSLSKGAGPSFITKLQDRFKSIKGLTGVIHKESRDALIIPFRAGTQLMGMMILFITKDHAFEGEQKNFFSAFGLQVSLSLEKALAFQEIMDQKNRMENLSKRLEEENISLREKVKAKQDRKFVIGKSPAMKEVMELVQRVAPTATNVIIYGETGTGKELIANAIHEMGPRRFKPMVKVNCAAIPEGLLESELFGHEKGAFTGAHDRKVGMFKLAQGGTIFLDEIGDISPQTQAKLLRALQASEIQPIGSKVSMKVDVRVIAATNNDLKEKIEQGTFRSDFYYRLNVFPITVPPLRKRKQDIPSLIDFFLEKYAHLKKGKAGIDNEVIEIFSKYTWPGNIRELENIIERLMIISGPGNISAKHLPRELTSRGRESSTVRPLKEALFDYKKGLVKQALAENNGKKSGAASMLGMQKSNFSRLLKQLGMS
jgi:transcriptional regulator with GAF, ATPase, and Fis domain